MAYVIAAPEPMTAAAADLAGIGSTLSAAHMTAATPTIAMLPAAADEVSARIAQLFAGHAQEYQALAGRAAAFHEEFVRRLTASAGSYAGAEAANSSSLRALTASAAAPAAAGLENLLTNLVLAELNLQLTALTVLQQLANSFPILNPLFLLAFAALLIETLLTFGILLALFPPVWP